MSTASHPRRCAPALRRACTGFLLLLSSSAPAFGTSFDERAQFLLDRLASQPVAIPGGAGKLPYGTAIAHLAATGGQDAAAREYLAGTGYGGELFFNSIQQVRGLYLARDFLTSAQRAAIMATATNPDNNWNNNGTENHRLMSWSSGYLLAQFYPDAHWTYGSATIGSAEMMSRLRDRIIEVGRNEYRAGYSEFLSPNYEIYHVAPMINLYDYADDPEVRAAAEAFLLYHFSALALGSFKEIVLPPWSRKAGEMDISVTGASAQWLLWLLWGHGNVESTRAMDPSLPLVFFAVSDWRPPAILDAIANRVVEFPYSTRMQQTHWQWNPTRYVMRTTWHDPLYAISSGVVRQLPTAFQLDDAQFMIAWDGSAPYRNLTAFHPYWRSVSQGEDYWAAPTSPFMQTGHHESTAIMLFDILAEDPWAGHGQWASERNGPVIPLAQVRYPAYLTSILDLTSNWVFLRGGSVYMGIRILQPGWLRDRRLFTDFHVIKSRGIDGERWQTGFIFEVGTEAQFGSFEAFQAALLANPVSVDWETMTASYTNCNGDVLVLRYNIYDPMDPGIPNHTVPDFSVNGTPVVYDETWPVLDSPWTSLEGQILQIQLDDSRVLSVDWSDTVPVIGTEEIPSWAGYPVWPTGEVDTGAFLGWIFPLGDWVYVPALGRYVYLPEAFVGDTGGWLLIPK